MHHAIALLSAVQVAVALPPVSEDIHSEGSGRPDVCGYSAETVEALEKIIQNSQGTEELARIPEYNAYATIDEKVLTFTTSLNKAHPAVACRFAYTTDAGTTQLSMQLSCFNSRENCDWLYREFKMLNERVLGDRPR